LKIHSNLKDQNRKYNFQVETEIRSAYGRETEKRSLFSWKNIFPQEQVFAEE
jgi:hypothetical protein